MRTSLVSFAQTLLVCRRRFGSGKAAFVGEDDLVGDATERLTGLFVGEGGFSYIIDVMFELL